MTEPKPILLMGVTGAGKTTVGRLLAARLGGRFVDGDDLHPRDTILKMSRGQALTEDDRKPWLTALSDVIANHDGRSVLIVACSALRESHRARLGRNSYRLVHLTGKREVIAERLDRRQDHFMPPELLTSQLAILEEPTEGLEIRVDRSPEEIVDAIIAALVR